MSKLVPFYFYFLTLGAEMVNTRSSTSSSLFFSDNASLQRDILTLLSSLNGGANVENTNSSPTSVLSFRGSTTKTSKEISETKSTGSKRKTVITPQNCCDNYHLDPDERNEGDFPLFATPLDIPKRYKADLRFGSSRTTLGRSYSLQNIQHLGASSDG